MRHLVIASALLGAACAQTGAIEGKIVVGPGQDGLAVMAVLWQQQPATAANGTTQPKLVALGQLAVGIAGRDGGTFDYTFHSLDKGTYVVGAYADLHDDRDITDDTRSIDEDSPLVVDPTDKTKQTLKHDVFVGVSAPDRATVRGTLHLSAHAAAAPLHLYVLTGGLNDPTAKVVGSATPGPGTDVPFALFNVPPGQVYLVAVADIGNDGNPENDLYAFYPLNPFTTTGGKDTTGVDLWMDRQAPELGSYAGKLVFNAPLATLRVQLLVLASAAQNGGAPQLGNQADIEAIVNLDATSTLEVPFVVPSLKKGSHFLAAVVVSHEGDGVTHSATRIYPGAGSGKEVALDTGDALSQELRFGLGVGRCSGTIKLHGAPAALKTVAVFALLPGGDVSPGVPGSPLIHDELAVAVQPTGGEAVASYQLFGLEDGTYDIALIPDLNGDGSVQDDYQANQTYNGTPLKVTVTGGGRVGSDFDVKLSR